MATNVITNTNHYGSVVAVDNKDSVYSYSGYTIVKEDAVTGIFSVYAGTGTAGYSGDGGQATAATIDGMCNINFDRSGNLYMGDAANNIIRKVNAVTGVITTVAGSASTLGGYDGDNMAATSALLHYPHDVVIDSYYNLYISDRMNGRIRKVDAATNIITTVAGGGSGGDGDDATSASISGGPIFSRFDSVGNLYISDGAYRIRMVTNLLFDMPSTMPSGSPTKTPTSVAPTSSTIISTTFSYTGSAQTYTVPDDIQYLLVEAYGAEGGSNACYSGGKGGYIKTIITVAPGDTLYVLVGGTSSSNFGGGYPNGGGYGWACSNFNGCNGGASVCQQPGGGSSEIRMIADDTSTRLVVAGAGGGAGFYGKGGEGGGSGGTGVGERGDVCGGCVASGYGGNVGFWNSGGGGGYYGGGSSNYDAGGGGSSHSSSDIILENTMGVNTGTGYVIITPVDSLPTAEPTLAPTKPASIISTIAGNGVYGSSSGDGDDALSATVNPWGVTLDSSGSKAYYFPIFPC